MEKESSIVHIPRQDALVDNDTEVVEHNDTSKIYPWLDFENNYNVTEALYALSLKLLTTNTTSFPQSEDGSSIQVQYKNSAIEDRDAVIDIIIAKLQSLFKIITGEPDKKVLELSLEETKNIRVQRIFTELKENHPDTGSRNDEKYGELIAELKSIRRMGKGESVNKINLSKIKYNLDKKRGELPNIQDFFKKLEGENSIYHQLYNVLKRELPNLIRLSNDPEIISNHLKSSYESNVEEFVTNINQSSTEQLARTQELYTQRSTIRRQIQELTLEKQKLEEQISRLSILAYSKFVSDNLATENLYILKQSIHQAITKLKSGVFLLKELMPLFEDRTTFNEVMELESCLNKLEGVFKIKKIDILTNFNKSLKAKSVFPNKIIKNIKDTKEIQLAYLRLRLYEKVFAKLNVKKGSLTVSKDIDEINTKIQLFDQQSAELAKIIGIIANKLLASFRLQFEYLETNLSPLKEKAAQNQSAIASLKKSRSTTSITIYEVGNRFEKLSQELSNLFNLGNTTSILRQEEFISRLNISLPGLYHDLCNLDD